MAQQLSPLLLISLLAVIATPARGQVREEETIRAASIVLDQTMGAAPMEIPRSLLNDARGVVIIPNMLKGSFVVGARFGRGVLLVRDEAGTWQLPYFVTLTGGSVGWQIGVQATDLILVFKTQRSVEGILAGKLTLGADAAVAAGPLGREAAAATDHRLSAEIYTYSRSRGLFAGVSLDGSVLQVDAAANALYYPAVAVGGAATAPASAVQLAHKVAMYTAAAPPAGGGLLPPALPNQAVDEASHVRNQLAQAAPQMYAVLDPQWRAYLALPTETFQGQQHPPLEAVQRSLTHFESVERDPRYAALAARPEFQSTSALLRRYSQLRTQTAGTIPLPAPPSGASPGAAQPYRR